MFFSWAAHCASMSVGSFVPPASKHAGQLKTITYMLDLCPDTPHSLHLVFCDLFLKFIPPINIWRICFNLRQFLKNLSVPLWSKGNRCWIFRKQPWNFVILSEHLPGNLEKVRQTSVQKTIPKFWFFYLFYCSSKT